MHQLDECAAKQKIESHESNHRGGIVEHASCALFHAAALFDEIGLQNIAKALEPAQGDDHLLEWFTPAHWSAVHIAEDRLHNLRDIGQLNLLMIDFRRCAQREI